MPAGAPGGDPGSPGAGRGVGESGRDAAGIGRGGNGPGNGGSPHGGPRGLGQDTRDNPNQGRDSGRDGQSGPRGGSRRTPAQDREVVSRELGGIGNFVNPQQRQMLGIEPATAEAISQELADLGIDSTLAPVTDLSTQAEEDLTTTEWVEQNILDNLLTVRLVRDALPALNKYGGAFWEAIGEALGVEIGPPGPLPGGRPGEGVGGDREREDRDQGDTDNGEDEEDEDEEDGDGDTTINDAHKAFIERMSALGFGDFANSVVAQHERGRALQNERIRRLVNFLNNVNARQE